jgi:hypothetical protein
MPPPPPDRLDEDPLVGRREGVGDVTVAGLGDPDRVGHPGTSRVPTLN